MFDPVSLGIASMIFLLLLLALGVHIAVALTLTGFLGLVLILGFMPASWSMASTIFWRIADYKFVVVPLFVMMGLLAAEGGVAKSLYDAAELWVGKFKAGLGIATVLGCTGFGTVCGSSMVCASIFSKVSAPQMRAHGYSKRLAYGLCASSGMIGMLIPPSVLIVIYSIVSGESIGRLLVGGTTPGLLLTLLFSITLLIIGRVRPDMVGGGRPLAINVTWRRRFASLPPLWPVFVTAAAIFGGLFGGIFNATEAASVGAAVMVLVSFILIGRKAFSQLAQSLHDTATISAMAFAIVVGAAVFSNFLTQSGTTKFVTNFIVNLNLSTIGLIVMIQVLYLFLGCFLDSTSMVCLTVPILHPTVVALGVDGVWYALVVIMTMEIGLITPPVGLNVFGAVAVAEKDVTIEDIYIGCAPFLIASVIALALMIAFPAISTTLPSLMFKNY